MREREAAPDGYADGNAFDYLFDPHLHKNHRSRHEQSVCDNPGEH